MNDFQLVEIDSTRGFLPQANSGSNMEQMRQSLQDLQPTEDMMRNLSPNLTATFKAVQSQSVIENPFEEQKETTSEHHLIGL